MIIRNYPKEDEEGWLECRLLSFYRSSYYDDVIFKSRHTLMMLLNL